MYIKYNYFKGIKYSLMFSDSCIGSTCCVYAESAFGKPFITLASKHKTDVKIGKVQLFWKSYRKLAKIGQICFCSVPALQQAFSPIRNRKGSSRFD